jgi:hypothetical protein
MSENPSRRDTAAPAGSAGQQKMSESFTLHLFVMALPHFSAATLSI